MIEVKYYLKGCKSLNDLHRQLVRVLTKGNVFLYHDEPDKARLLAEKLAEAEALTLELIQQQIETIPAKIKRDLVTL